MISLGPSDEEDVGPDLQDAYAAAGRVRAVPHLRSGGLRSALRRPASSGGGSHGGGGGHGGGGHARRPHPSFPFPGGIGESSFVPADNRLQTGMMGIYNDEPDPFTQAENIRLQRLQAQRSALDKAFYDDHEIDQDTYAEGKAQLNGIIGPLTGRKMQAQAALLQQQAAIAEQQAVKLAGHNQAQKALDAQGALNKVVPIYTDGQLVGHYVVQGPDKSQFYPYKEAAGSSRQQPQAKPFDHTHAEKQVEAWINALHPEWKGQDEKIVTAKPEYQELFKKGMNALGVSPDSPTLSGGRGAMAPDAQWRAQQMGGTGEQAQADMLMKNRMAAGLDPMTGQTAQMGPPAPTAEQQQATAQQQTIQDIQEQIRRRAAERQQQAQPAPAEQPPEESQPFGVEYQGSS